MSYAKNVYQTDAGWQYDITSDEAVIIHQDYDPEAPGLILMDEARANEAADVVLERLS